MTRRVHIGVVWPCFSKVSRDSTRRAADSRFHFRRTAAPASSTATTSGSSPSWSPVLVRVRTLHRPVEPEPHDCVKVIVARDDSATLFSEFGQKAARPGDVVLLGANTLCGLAGLAGKTQNEFARFLLVSDVFSVARPGKGRPPRPLAAPEPGPARLRPEVRSAIVLLEQQISRAWRMDELAHEVALSTSQLGRLFREQLDVSPAAYLSQLRAERMAELLSTSSLGIAEAAQAVGWDNVTVGSRVFRRRYGVSPRAFVARASRRLAVGA